MADWKNEWETLEKIPEIIASFMGDVPEEKLHVRRSETAWTIGEHFLHIVQVQEMLLERIRLIRNSQDPVIEPYFPENDEIPILGVEEAMEKYRSLRKKQMEELRSCRPGELARKAVHREYTDYSIPIIVRHMIFHEYWHMYRIEELLYTRKEYFS